MAKIHVIGFGNKARQGKDESAKIISSMRSNVHILHFADALKEECTNAERKYPLIRSSGLATQFGKIRYAILSDISRGLVKLVYEDEVPFLHKIFMERKITEYAGMDEKDGPILQFWGTNFRRNMCDDKYWVKRLNDKIQQIIESAPDTADTYILVPDTRFINEYNFIKNFRHGLYVRVERLNDDNTQHLATDRDNNHPSELELDGSLTDYILRAKTLYDLKLQNERFLDYVDNLSTLY